MPPSGYIPRALEPVLRRPVREFPAIVVTGPRQAGKTTWLKQVLPDALWFDLLRIQVVLGLVRQPESFRLLADAVRLRALLTWRTPGGFVS